jgi:hypothetical protein
MLSPRSIRLSDDPARASAAEDKSTLPAFATDASLRQYAAGAHASGLVQVGAELLQHGSQLRDREAQLEGVVVRCSNSVDDGGLAVVIEVPD